MTLSSIVVTGSWPSGAGSGAAYGSVSFTPSTLLTDSTDQLIIPPVPIVAPLYAGRFSIPLVCTDNANISPSGWYYIVSPIINGVALTPWNVLLPHTLGSTVDLSSLTPVSPGPAVSTLFGVLAASNTNTWLSNQVFDGGIQIPASAANGKVWTSDANGNGSWQVSGSAPVTSVFGRTGVVAAAANDYSFNQIAGTAAAGQLPAATTSQQGAVILDGTAADIQPLGTQAAGAKGQAADSEHVHAMPRLDQVNAPTAAVSLNNEKITSLANGSAASDGAAFGQIPLINSTAGTIAPLGTQAAGSSGKTADAAHVHPTTGLLLGYVFDEPSLRGYSEANLMSSLSPTANTLTSGTIYGVTIYCQTSSTVSKFAYHLSTAAGTPVAGENLMGLYSVSGSTWTQQAISSDLGTWGTTNQLNNAVFSSSVTYTLTPGAWVSVLFVCNATTACALRGLNNTAPGYLNDGCSNAAPYWYRFFSIGTGTALPSTFAASSMVTTAAVGALIYLG